MGSRLTEDLTIDLGIVGQAIDNNNVTGRYIPMAGHRNAVAVAIGGAQAATKKTKIEWVQAKNLAGESVKDVASSSAEGTSGTKDTAATITLTSAENTDTVTINSVVFTKADANDTDAAEFLDDDGLVDCIEASSIADQVTATASSDVVTLIAKDGYTVTTSKTQNSGTITLATTQHMVISEINVDDIDYDDDFLYVAPKITCTGDGVYSVVVIRDRRGVPHTQLAQALTAL
ncbi:MAG: hypothetical protein AVO39_10955 [delta proteobacterium MLS_D]|nr:MAG: hypothetical protein AVO39_10955 [delta proteobacterium MLS_D]